MHQNYVFIARSLDGYIADKNGGLDWLNTVPNPQNIDLGYQGFIKTMDAIVMGRKTFEVVCGFDIPWPYTIPVFILSRSLQTIPDEHQNKTEIVKGSLPEILDFIHKKGHSKLYIDGGATIQSFLQEDLIDELIISTIPVLLGGGIPLFGKLPGHMEFEHVESKVYLNAITQNRYKRKI